MGYRVHIVSYLAVYQTLPVTANEQFGGLIREAMDSGAARFYHCPMCNGWVDGLPIWHKVENKDAAFCRRCGVQLI